MKHSTIIALSIVAVLGILSLSWPGEYLVYAKKDEETKDRLSVYLDALEQYECRGCLPGYKRLDSNGKYSYGCLQFQVATFREMVKSHDLVPERKYDDTLDIGRCEDQKRVARAMFSKCEECAARHWYTSIYTRGLGLP